MGSWSGNPDIYRRWRVRVEPLGESWRERLRSGGSVLFGASMLLLMIAAVNVGCLLLTRVLDRRRELAIRAALGADARRIVAQLFVEALLLVSAGGVVGMLAGPWLFDAFLALAPLDRLTLPRYLRLEPDTVTLALAVAALTVAGLLAGTVPAFLGRPTAPADVLRAGGRGTLARTTERRWTSALIVVETALTLVLLVAGSLLVRSYARLSSADLGFERDRIARLAVTLSPADFGSREQLPSIYERLARELKTVAGVERIGLVSPTLPPWDGYRSRLRPDGVELPQTPDGLEVGTHMADHELLPMLGIGIISGRGIEPRDDRGSADVAVISRSLAVFFGGPEAAIGRMVNLAGRDAASMPNGTFRVVGVSEDVAYDGLVEEDTRRFTFDTVDSRTARHDVYVPLAQFPSTVVSIGASSAGDAAALIEQLRRRISSIAPSSAVHWTSTMADEIATEYQPTRFYAVLVAVFSTSALALTSVGLFALLAHAASRRTGEMGLRLALGASRGSTVTLLLKDGFATLAVGIAAGAGLALVVTRGIAGLLYGPSRFDVVSVSTSVLLMVAVALAAGAIPAKRIASIDPATILRSDS